MTECNYCGHRGVVCTESSCELADPEMPYTLSMCRPCWVRLGGPTDRPTADHTPLLGDTVHRALSAVGITPESLSGWLGKECGCKERQERLNALDAWARRVVAGRVDRAGEFLKKILGGGDR